MEEFLAKREVSKEALLKGIAESKTETPETKKSLEKEIEALTSQAQACKVLSSKKTAQETTSELLGKFRKKIAAVYQKNIASDGKNFNKPKTDFGLTLERYQKIAVALAEYAEKYEEMLCTLESLPPDPDLPIGPRRMYWLQAMKYLVEEKPELVLATKQNAKKIDRIILRKQGKVQAELKEKKADQKKTTASQQGDHDAAELWTQIGRVHARAAQYYQDAARAETENNTDAAQAFYESAQAYEQYAVDFQQEDQAAAELWAQIGDVHALAARRYQDAARVETENNTDAAQSFYKSAQACEQQVEVVRQQLEKLRLSRTGSQGL